MTITRKQLRKSIREKRNITLRKRKKSKLKRKKRSFRKNRHVNLRTSSLRRGGALKKKRLKRKIKKKSTSKRKAIQQQNKRTRKNKTRKTNTKPKPRSKKVAAKGTKKKTVVKSTKKQATTKNPVAKKTASGKDVRTKKSVVKKPVAKKTASGKDTQTKKPVVKNPVGKANVTPVSKVVQTTVPQKHALQSIPPSQVVNIKTVENAAKKTNKKIVKQAEALETTNNTTAKQILIAKNNLKKAIDNSFGSIQTALKTSEEKTKNLAESIKKTTTPIQAKKTPSGKKILKIAVITDKDAQTLVDNPGGGTVAAAMTNQKNIIN